MIDSTGGWVGGWLGGWLAGWVLLNLMIALASLEPINDIVWWYHTKLEESER